MAIVKRFVPELFLVSGASGLFMKDEPTEGN
jgi:hypothetical protein